MRVDCAQKGIANPRFKASGLQIRWNGYPVNGTITVENTDKVTFRVADSFVITGPFQADSGCEFTVIRQDCPD